ncbi:hypothetical protein OC845_001321 [Tilletia horrida]|nr:hypothetical protein OC845_001321 [Tilletia horrida]
MMTSCGCGALRRVIAPLSSETATRLSRVPSASVASSSSSSSSRRTFSSPTASSSSSTATQADVERVPRQKRGSSSSSSSATFDSIYPESQAALRPNPYARSPLYTHAIRARSETLQQSDAAPKVVGEQPQVARLNEALRIAVSRKQDTAVANILDQFEQLSIGSSASKTVPSKMLPIQKRRASLLSTQDTVKAAAVLSAQEPLLSPNFTKHWSAVTYYYVLLHCHDTSRSEFALAVLGSAFHHAGCDINALGNYFTAATCGLLIRTLINARQARLAYELALWLNSGDASLLHKNYWYSILTACAKHQHLPGVIRSWKRSVAKGNDLIDEGLLLQVLETASRSGAADFCIEVLRRAMVKNGEAPTLTLHQSLLAPLFEAFCVSEDFESAIRVLSRMQAAGMEVRRHAASPLSGALSAALLRSEDDKTSQAMAQKILTALRNVGSAYVEQNLKSDSSGVHLTAFNAVILGAIWGKRVDLAHDIYKLRTELLGVEGGVARTLNPSLDEFLAKPDSIDASTEPSSPAEIADQLTKRRLLPDLDTFHALISACADTGEIRLARKLLQDLNGYSLEPTAETYQRLVKLCLACAPLVYGSAARAEQAAKLVTEQEREAFANRPFGEQTFSQRASASSSASATDARPSSAPSYEDAFKLMDECKKRALIPTQATYEALVWRCWREHDDRWFDVFVEMKESAGYIPSWDLLVTIEPGLRVMRQTSRTDPEVEDEYEDAGYPRRGRTRPPRSMHVDR